MVKRFSYYITLLAVVLLSACSSDEATNEQPLPEGMGRIRITICTPETVGGDSQSPISRAVNTTTIWLDPDHEWERLQTFRILICDADNKVVQIIAGDKNDMTAVSGTSYPYKQSAEKTSQPLPAGTYNIYATANYADGYTVGQTVNPDATVKFANGYSPTGTTAFGDANPIPMTGRLTGISVSNGSSTNVTIAVWRVLSKLQFYFTNESKEQVDIYGIEVEPVNTDSENKGLVYLFSKDDLTSTDNFDAGGVTLPLSVETGRVRYETSTTDPLQTLNAYSGTGEKPTGTLFFYVNETDATYTTTQNQLSLRFKIKRGGTIQEVRYGVTTNYEDGENKPKGFNVIRRNDWIHIPIILTDWQFRVEPIAFAPIAGYPATLLSSDALTATFSTGGMIALQPFVKKKGDNTWLDYSDTRITNLSVTWKNSNGVNVSGNDKIVKTAFAYDPVTRSIIGELNNNLGSGTYMTTFTVNAQLDNYPYSFTFNVILQK